jgi:hypothetical protein
MDHRRAAETGVPKWHGLQDVYEPASADQWRAEKRIDAGFRSRGNGGQITRNRTGQVKLSDNTNLNQKDNVHDDS